MIEAIVSYFYIYIYLIYFVSIYKLHMCVARVQTYSETLCFIVISR